MLAGKTDIVRDTKGQVTLHLNTTMLVSMTAMAEKREISLHKLLEELVELGLMSLAKDARPPALDPWRMGAEPFLGFQGDRD